jgi:hypothetical protein
VTAVNCRNCRTPLWPVVTRSVPPNRSTGVPAPGHVKAPFGARRGVRASGSRKGRNTQEKGRLADGPVGQHEADAELMSDDNRCHARGSQGGACAQRTKRTHGFTSSETSSGQVSAGEPRYLPPTVAPAPPARSRVATLAAAARTRLLGRLFIGTSSLRTWRARLATARGGGS